MGRFDKLKLGLLTLALVNMVPAIEADRSWGFLVVAGFAAVLSVVLAKPGGGSHLPRWLMHVLVFLSIGFLLNEIYGLFGEREEDTVFMLDLAHFMVLLTSCKFFDLRGNRDLGIVALVTFLLFVVGAFVSASVLFGMVAIVDLIFGAAWVSSMQARSEMDGILARRRRALAIMPTISSEPALGAVTGSSGATSVSSEPLKRLATARRAAIPLSVVAASPETVEFANRARRGYTRTTLFCTALLAGIMVVAFVLIPRGFGEGWLGGVQGIIHVATTGFDDAVQLDDVQVVPTESPVMRVRFLREGEPIVDPAFQPYMRGTTFDLYLDGRWQRTHGFAGGFLPEIGTKDEPAPLVAFDAAKRDNHVVRQEVWLQGIGKGFLFSMYPPLTLGSPDIRRVQPDDADFALRTNQRLGGEVQYTIDAPLIVTPELAKVLRVRQAGWPRYVRPRSISPRVRKLAHEMASRIGDPTDQRQHERVAQAFTNYLRSKTFTYSLDRGPMSSEIDPIEDFLFENRSGHCEYFASAMTLMCQEVGLSARLVNGYCGGDLNHAGAFYQFRERDAHAWVEVYLPDRGWTTFDPTPASHRNARARRSGLMAETRRWIDYLQFSWSAFVVSFDSRTRLRLADGASIWFGKLWAAFGGGDGPRLSLWESLKTLFWGPKVFGLWQRVSYWFLLILVSAFIVLLVRVVWIFSLLIRERLPHAIEAGRQIVRQPEARFYDRLLLLLANKGHVKAGHDTPREFAESAARTSQDLADLPQYTEWFYEAQYGRRSLASDRRERIRGFMRRLREDSSFGTSR